MKSQTLFYFLFFLLIINFVSAGCETAPLQTLNIDDQNLGLGSTTTLYVKNYFANSDFSGIDFWYNSSSGMVAVDIYRQFGQGKFCSSKEFYVCITPTSDDFEIQITSLGNRGTYEFGLTVYNVSCYNPSDPSSLNFTRETFDVISGVTTNYTDGVGAPRTDGFIGSLANGFISIYPDADDLSLSAKFGYVFVTILFWFVLYYGIIYFVIQGKVEKLSSFFHYIFFIVGIVLTFFFIAISYIPLGVLIVVVLVLAVLGFFRFKSGFTQK